MSDAIIKNPDLKLGVKWFNADLELRRLIRVTTELAEDLKAAELEERDLYRQVAESFKLPDQPGKPRRARAGRSFVVHRNGSVFSVDVSHLGGRWEQLEDPEGTCQRPAATS